MEGIQHHVGSPCVRLLVERLGWHVSCLAADVPVEEFAVIQRGRDATLVCVSLPPGTQRGDVARALRVLTEFHDPSRPYALAPGGGVPDGVGSLEGPFVAVRGFASCEELRAALVDGFARLHVPGQWDRDEAARVELAATEVAEPAGSAG